MTSDSDILKLIKAMIRSRGSISIADYMMLCSQHPDAGYYRQEPAIGPKADFITAPEASQIFGELIGLCLAQHAMDVSGLIAKKVAGESPGRDGLDCDLIELGPGRGTLMADMVRTLERAGLSAMTRSILLVETNATLRAAQERAVGRLNPQWFDDFSSIPVARRCCVVANEFLDALPIRQFIRHQARWFERVVTLDGERLVFGQVPAGAPVAQTLDVHSGHPVPPDQKAPPDWPVQDGCVLETSPARDMLTQEIARKIMAFGGAAIFVDYGDSDASLFGDSFQAVRAHRKVDPLERPGQADLTSHVDFGALRRSAMALGLRVQGPVDQAVFLNNLGANLRLTQLQAKADASTREKLERGYQRLVADDQMGRLFKVMALTAPGEPPLGGFETDAPQI